MTTLSSFPCGDQLAVERGEVGVVAHGLGELARAVGGGGDQGLQIELVLLHDGVGDVGEQLSAIACRLPELAERVEEVVVARLVGGEVLHRPGADDALPELGVGPGVGGRTRARSAGRAYGRRRRVDAQPVLAREPDEVLGGDRTRQVVVEVASLGQCGEEGLQSRRVAPQLVEPGVGPALGRGGGTGRHLRGGPGGRVLRGGGGGRDRGEQGEEGECADPGRDQGLGTVCRPNR